MFNTLRASSLLPYKFKNPSIDISCGDGIFSFIVAGGELDQHFDKFLAVDTSGFRRKADIHDFVPENHDIIINKAPDYRFDVGTDWKGSMLKKAQLLGMYGKLLLQDNNKPFNFPDGFFKTIYSNSAYWVSEVDSFLREVRRILDDDGMVYLHLVTRDIVRFSVVDLSNPDNFLLDSLDRGRMANYKVLLSREEWVKKLTDHGFNIETITATLNEPQAKVWNIGLRPINNFLVEMANSLDADKRFQIKKEWCDFFIQAAGPFFELTSQDSKLGCDLLFVLRKITRSD